MNRTAVAAVVTLGLVAPALAAMVAAQDTLTLERAIALSLEANHQLLAAGARTSAAEAALEEARARRLPALDLDLGYQRTTNPTLVFSNLLGQGSFSEENFAIDSLNRPDPLDNWRSRVSVELPLWTAGRLSHGIGAARLGRSAAASEEEAMRQQIVHRVMDAYSAAVMAQGELGAARASLETAEAHLALARDLFESGLVVESDALQAEVRESETTEQVITAESHVAVSRAALNVVIGRQPDEPLSLPDELPPGNVDTKGSAVRQLAELEAGALARRPDLRAARERWEAARQLLAVERSGRWPELGLAGSWEANAEDFIGNDGDNWVVGLGLRWSLFDGFATRSRIRQAENRAVEAEQALLALRDGVAIEVRRAFYDLRAAHERLEQANRGIELASRSLSIVEDRYREGLTVLAELLDAQSALARSRLRQVAARRDVLLATAGLELAIGNL